MKSIILLSIVILTTSIYAESLAQDGISIEVIDKDGKKDSVDIFRDIPDECLSSFKPTPQNMWGEAYASKKVPKECKVSVVTTIGKITPMKLSEGVETYGELEVLKFLKEISNKKDGSMLFIDSRTNSWYKQRTIPGAINVPFTYFKGKELSEDGKKALLSFGVTKKGKSYDFSKAKELLIFCNGIWCGQSPKMIKSLLNLGYPANKIKWYRGGMHSWLSLNLTSTKDKVYK